MTVSLKERLRDLVAEVSTKTGAFSSEIVGDLLRYGEPRLALEILCNHLTEADIALPKQTWGELEALCAELGVDRSYISAVRQEAELG
ncbi:MAG: MafI family immunity protein [Sandaracinaceae bacterium]|nr:MafI family immunity protein [Sandaracinaceae bacterium]